MRAPVKRARAAGGAPRGFFLSLEGIEGSGKTTHARLLEEGLRERGYRVVMTREPGGTPLGEALRDLLLGTEGDTPVAEAELFMLLAARAQHLQRFILPRLDRGEVVLCDRFADASLAYQGGGRQLGLDRVDEINAFATAGIVPDYTVFFDVAVDEALERVGRRGAKGGEYNRFDQEIREFHERVRAAYLHLLEREPDRFLRVDSTADKQDVARAVLTAVEPLLMRRREDGGLA
jgi:dTMP kinase